MNARRLLVLAAMAATIVVLAAWLALVPVRASSSPVGYWAEPFDFDAAPISARPGSGIHPQLPSAVEAQGPNIGDPLPRVICPEGFEVSVYASGLSSPGGLAFDPNGVLHIADENAGRVLRIDAGGDLTPLISGLDHPEGIAFDPTGNLYVVEDVRDGRLLRVSPDGSPTVLAEGLDAPEGVAWSPEGDLYATVSNVQFVENIPWDVVTGITRISPVGEVTKVVTDTLFWSYSAIALGGDGWLYVANEASNIGTTDSVFRVDPSTGERTLFASGLTAPEGIHFSQDGAFPAYVTEERLETGVGRFGLLRANGTYLPLCTGFRYPEGVAVGPDGSVYVGDDDGLVVRVRVPDLSPPPPPRELSLSPPEWAVTNSFTLTWENPFDPSGIAGAYLKVAELPTRITDGVLYSGDMLTQITGIQVAGPGVHTAVVWLEDGAGNADHTSAAVATLRYDPDPPGSPQDLLASGAPDGLGNWSPTNRFTLTWTNPPEVSGVLTACYQFGAPPQLMAEPETCQSEANVQQFTDVTVPDNGGHAVHVWLADAAGNVDPASAVSATLLYDALPPVSVASAPATAHTAPIRVTWVATDTHSGVDWVALWVKKEEDGLWQDSGLSSPAAGPGFFLYEPAGPGTYSFATVATDHATNREGEPVGNGDVQTSCQTWQRLYLPVLWRDGP